MSYNTFPTLEGLGWPIKVTPTFKTIVQQAASGAEYRTGLWQNPLRTIDVPINYLTQTDWNTLLNFFVGQQGALVPFLFAVTNDNSQTARSFGTGNGTVTAFPLPLPVNAQVTGTPAIYANGTQIYSTGTGTPATPTLGQVAGGTKAARTYYVRIEYVNAAAGTSPASAEVSLAVALDSLLTVAAPAAAPGATLWQVFIGTAANGETLAATLAMGANYTEPTSALPSGGGYSTTDGTTFAVSNTGTVTFASAPASATALTWTGTYAYVARFPDGLDFEQFMSQLYRTKTLKLQEVR